MIVFDASALLAFVQIEPGADQVERALLGGGIRCGAADWSEAGKKIHDGEEAAGRWRPGPRLSLADHLCLALGARMGAPMVTADRASVTAEAGPGRPSRQISGVGPRSTSPPPGAFLPLADLV
ncbi:MAG: hypothetical protein ACRDY5_08885, partial [Acidimicrobiales bacterium]